MRLAVPHKQGDSNHLGLTCLAYHPSPVPPQGGTEVPPANVKPASPRHLTASFPIWSPPASPIGFDDFPN
jgi:hypothetical protein